MPNPTTPEMMPAQPRSSPNVLEWILVVLMVVALVGLGYLYFALMQLSESVSSTNAEVMEVKQELMAQKEVMMEEESDAIPYGDDGLGDNRSSIITQLDRVCAALGWTAWHDERSPIGFCYPPFWGTATWVDDQMSPEAQRGKSYYIRFSTEMSPAPRIVLQTLDYTKLLDSDVGAWQFVAFQPQRTSEEILAALPEYEGVTRVARIAADGVPAWKAWVHRLNVDSLYYDGVDYYIPSIGRTTPMNVILLGSNLEPDFDQLIQTMRAL